MRERKNAGEKHYILLALIVSAVFLGILAGSITIQFGMYRQVENERIAAILTQVQQEYPNADMTELIQILNGTQREADYGLLEQYGITRDTYVILDMEKQQRRICVSSLFLLLLCVFFLFVIFAGYRRERQKKIHLLSRYMERIARGEYELELDGNSEDALSEMQNQLYKITLMMREQAELAKRQKLALADSVSDISHQLKTPLTSISILLDNLLESKEMPPETQQKFLKEMDRQILTLNWMVIAMLKLSRLDTGVVEFEKNEIAIGKLLTEVCTNLEVIAEVQEVDVAIEGLPDEGDFIISGDYNWNREAVTNIVKNAMEHSQKGTTVRIRVEQNAVYTRIAVSNYGDPIPKEQQKQIFTRYYSASNSETGIGGIHMGLGLPLAKAIIERQNGYLTVESEGMETTFSIKYNFVTK